MGGRVWETLSDNVIDHAGITARATKNACAVLSRQWWRTPRGRSDTYRRLLWMAPMKVLTNHAGAVSGEEERYWNVTCK